MWGLGVEWVSLLYKVVSGILGKLAQDKKALQRTDIRDALMQLLHLLREWHRAAQMTNWILEDWSQKGKPADYEQLDNAMQLQYNAVEHVLYVAGYPSQHYDPVRTKRGKKHRKRKKMDDRNLLTVLFAYAPELEKDVRRIIDQRLDHLTLLRARIEQRTDPLVLDNAVKHLTNNPSTSIHTDFNPAELEQFKTSLEELDRLAHTVALFITEHFELEGVTVEDLSTIKRVAETRGAQLF
jgi:hypothetical protein